MKDNTVKSYFSRENVRPSNREENDKPRNILYKVVGRDVLKPPKTFIEGFEDLQERLGDLYLDLQEDVELSKSRVGHFLNYLKGGKPLEVIHEDPYHFVMNPAAMYSSELSVKDKFFGRKPDNIPSCNRCGGENKHKGFLSLMDKSELKHGLCVKCDKEYMKREKPVRNLINHL